MRDWPKPRNTERDRQIAAMREGGATLAATAQRFGLTRERIRQIVARHHRRRGLAGERTPTP
jgi:DNA-directed RNA polymerase sigma subunit (sigma70/sigma32)